MSWLQVNIAQFLEKVPVSKMPIHLEKMISILIASGKKALIVLNPQDVPLGVIESKNIAGITDWTSVRLEEILTLAYSQYETTKVGEFLSNLQQPEKNIQIVRDREGKCLGIVDPWLLLKYIQKEQTASLLEEKKILQQWDIPAMLQDEKGEIIHHNASWQKNLGNSLPLEVLLLYKSSQVTTSQTLQKQQIDCLQDSPYLAEYARGVTALQLNYPHFVSLPSEKDWQFLYFPLAYSSVNATSVRLILALNRQTDQQTADLLQLSRSKDNLLNCISHELKSPLTTVVGLANLLIQEKVGQLNIRQMTYAESIYSNGRQLMTLVNNLLDLTHLEAGELTLSLRPAKIRQVCEQAYASIVAKYQNNKQSLIAFKLKIEPGIEEIVADETRLHQMLVHLLDNAVKFTEQDGEFGIKVSVRENWLVITVWDTGSGIAEQLQPFLLQKLTKEHQMSEIGLGLVVTQRLALLHGGDLSFISEVNQGTQFTLLLPHTQETNSQICQSLALIADFTSQTIEPIRQILRKADYWIIVARTGTEALDKIRLLQPSIVFINPLLPILSGWDLIQLIKADPTTERIKIVVTATLKEEKQAHQMRVEGFLSLPIQENDLQRVLQQFTPTVVKYQPLTILHLHKTDTAINLKALLEYLPLEPCILEADDLEQAELLAQVWPIDFIFLDFKSDQFSVLEYLKEIVASSLADFPLVTLDIELFKLARTSLQLKITYGFSEYLSS